MLKEISTLAQNFNNVEDIKKELKNVQSIKCRLKKQKYTQDYELKMTEVIKYEQALKEAREYFEPSKITVTTMGEKEISLLDLDATIKAIKSIQSKKCRVQFSTKDIKDNIEYQDCLRIENLLLSHKATLTKDLNTISKSDLNSYIASLESLDKVNKTKVINDLKNLLNK